MAKICISLTYSDLVEHRWQVYDILRKMRYDVMAMEDHHHKRCASGHRGRWGGMGKTALTCRVLAGVDIVRTVAVFRGSRRARWRRPAERQACP